tara:strand:+ start:246 stop:500 length:255 start_codon:yes stop_codon:yes gene_type:complete
MQIKVQSNRALQKSIFYYTIKNNEDIETEIIPTDSLSTFQETIKEISVYYEKTEKRIFLCIDDTKSKLVKIYYTLFYKRSSIMD